MEKKITILGVYVSSLYAMSHLCIQILVTEKIHKDTAREDLKMNTVTKDQGCLKKQVWYAKFIQPTVNHGPQSYTFFAIIVLFKAVCSFSKY